MRNKKIQHHQNNSKIQSENYRNGQNQYPQHIYMTAHSPVLVQALQ